MNAEQDSRIEQQSKDLESELRNTEFDGKEIEWREDSWIGKVTLKKKYLGCIIADGKIPVMIAETNTHYFYKQVLYEGDSKEKIQIFAQAKKGTPDEKIPCCYACGTQAKIKIYDVLSQNKRRFYCPKCESKHPQFLGIIEAIRITT